MADTKRGLSVFPGEASWAQANEPREGLKSFSLIGYDGVEPCP